MLDVVLGREAYQFGVRDNYPSAKTLRLEVFSLDQVVNAATGATKLTGHFLSGVKYS
jgi:hypothetical protein